MMRKTVELSFPSDDFFGKRYMHSKTVTFVISLISLKKKCTRIMNSFTDLPSKYR